jgi:D-alanyl-D-alanine carboxypeptidase
MAALASAFLLAGLATGLATASEATSARGQATPLHPSNVSELQADLDRLVPLGAPGAMLLVRDGVQAARLTSGYGNLETRAPMSTTDRFRVGSVTKSYVATAVLQLAGDGRLRLEDSVERWLPGLVPNGRNITVRQLLNHRSGLYDFFSDPTVVQPYLEGNFAHYWAPRELVKIAVSHEPGFAPGARFEYTNTGYFLLGLIAEAASGRSMGAQLSKGIFKPLKIQRTSLATSPRISGAHTHGYLMLDRPPLIDTTGVMPFTWTAGAMVSTVNDVARFYRGLLDGRLLAPRFLQAMQKTTSSGPAPGIQTGLGLFSRQTPCGLAWGHSGNEMGYMSNAWSSRDGKRQIVLFVNIDRDSLPKAGQEAVADLITNAYCR